MSSRKLLAVFLLCWFFSLEIRAAETVVDQEIQAQLSHEEELHAKLLAQVKEEIEVLQQKERATTDPAARRRLERRRAELSKLLTEVERRKTQPSRTRYVSPTRPEPLFEPYRKSVAQKIEAYGSAHFPKSNGTSLYGRVVLIVTIGSRGTLEEVEVASSSGIPALDKHALKAARTSSPFGTFSPEINEIADHLVFVFPVVYRKEGEN